MESLVQTLGAVPELTRSFQNQVGRATDNITTDREWGKQKINMYVTLRGENALVYSFNVYWPGIFRVTFFDRSADVFQNDLNQSRMVTRNRTAMKCLPQRSRAY